MTILNSAYIKIKEGIVIKLFLIPISYHIITRSDSMLMGVNQYENN